MLWLPPKIAVRRGHYADQSVTNQDDTNHDGTGDEAAPLYCNWSRFCMVLE
jgi:hypothetical protein